MVYFVLLHCYCSFLFAWFSFLPRLRRRLLLVVRVACPSNLDPRSLSFSRTGRVLVLAACLSFSPTGNRPFIFCNSPKVFSSINRLISAIASLLFFLLYYAEPHTFRKIFAYVRLPP